MLRIYPHSGSDVRYFTDDSALELEGLRDGPAGRWLRGSGDVGAEAVQAILTPSARSRTNGYDLVVAAPRPVSILLALDPAEAPALIRAHQRSVGHAMTYLEDRGLVVRSRGAGGDFEDAAQWGAMAAFTHGVNRHGEPHLHDHVVVGSQPIGETRQLDARALAAHAPVADALYKAALRFDLGQSTSWRAWRSRSGGDHVAGLDEGYRALWGGHFDDRPSKQSWSRAAIVHRWESDLERFEALTVLPEPRRNPHVLDEYSFSAYLEGLYGLTRRDLVAAAAHATPFGADVAQLQESIDLYYPSLIDSRGLREPQISQRAARMTALVQERGARPLEASQALAWNQRSRERSLERASRSR